MADARESLRKRLKATGRSFETDGPLGGECARIRFLGTLRRQEVLWQATLMTLAHHYRRLSPADREQGVRQFIDVEPVRDGQAHISIGLNLSRIDETAVRKTLIMVRQWKRLGPGRHEYGATHHFGAALAGQAPPDPIVNRRDDGV